ncbi:MAG: hypothetical protein ACR2JX_02610 [Mycobacteriales bacterium]
MVSFGDREPLTVVFFVVLDDQSELAAGALAELSAELAPPEPGLGELADGTWLSGEGTPVSCSTKQTLPYH